LNVSFSKTVIGVLIAAVAAVAAADCSDKRRSPTAPETGAAAITIENGTTTATKRTVVQGPFTYTVSSTLRETSAVGATISQVTATVTDNSGAATVTQIAPADAFGTTRIQANGTLTSTGIVVMGSLATASDITVRVAFIDDHGNTGSAQASTGVKAEFTGTWSGHTTTIQPPGDWSVITMSLVQNGDALTGEVITRDGRHFPVTGCASCGGTLPGLSLVSMPGSSGHSCAIGLNLQDFAFSGGRMQKMTGQLQGRCPSTEAGTADLQRSS
jgi:hypothetical protein